LDNNKITITVNNNRFIECGQGDNLFSVLSGAGYVFSEIVESEVPASGVLLI